MEITLFTNEVTQGPFSVEEIRAKLAAGKITLDEWAFTEGLSEWTPLREVLAMAPPEGMAAISTPPPVPTHLLAGAAAAPVQTVSPPGAYGDFFLRLAAHVIDTLILMIPLGIMMAFFFWDMTSTLSDLPRPTEGKMDPVTAEKIFEILGDEMIVWGIFMLILVLYYALQEGGPEQATIGKRLMGLKVTDLHGEPISYARATGRVFSKMVGSLIPFAFGFIMASFTQRKQALHDMMASTLVLKK